MQPLLDNLTQRLNTLILRSPENFVCPSAWSKYRDSLQACLPAGDEARHNSFAAINLRNEQLAAAANRSQPAARHILVRMLDGTLQASMSPELPQQCWGISKDKEALARALLEWCTSLYRPGLAKIYVTNRILQHWSTLGLDPTMAVLDFLEADACEDEPRKATLYHIVCELVREEIFSVPRYLRWLIARGGVRSSEDVSPTAPAPTRLLVEIPACALTPSQKSLRSAALRRASFNVADEAQDVDLAIRHVKHTLGLPMDPADPLLEHTPMSLKKLIRRISSANRALKAELGYWFRASFAAHAEANEEGGQALDISPAIFYAVRSVLEAADDFSVLGDIMKMLTKNASVEILAAISDTISRHFFIFSALGDTLPLFQSLHQRLKAADREQGFALRPLLASLVALAPRLPVMEELASQLKKDLALNDRQNPVDACSPVSDNMVARLQDDAGELHEEIEKLLAGGSSLDRNTMERLFQTIVQRLQASWDKAPDKQRAYSSLLGRLRLFNTQHFDGLMVKWLLFLRTLGSRPSILRIFPLLVSVGCLDMCAILATASEFAGQGAGTARTPSAATSPQVVQTTYRTRYMQEVLQLLTAPIRQNDLLTVDEVYRFAIHQDQAIRDCPKEVLGLILLASAEYSYAKGQNDDEALPLETESVRASLLGLLKRLVLRDAAAVARALSVRSSNPHVGGLIDSLTTDLLIPTADSHKQVTFDQVLELTNEFTLPFCQVKLALSLSSNEQGHETGDRQQSHVELFANAMDKAISAGNITWVGMLSCLSPDITQHLKLRAQNRFLELLPSLRSPPTPDAALQQTLQMAENLLSVIDAITRGSPASARQPHLPPLVVDKLVDLWELLASPDDPESMPTADTTDPKLAVLTHWLPLTLNFITLHAQQATFDPSSSAVSASAPSSSKPAATPATAVDVRARILVACAALMQELDSSVHHHLTTSPSGEFDTRPLARRLFDLSCLLVDGIGEEARGMCVRAVRECAGGDARLRYLFSFGSGSGIGEGGAEEGMVLALREKGPGAVGGAGMGGNNGRGANAGAGGGGGGGNTMFSGLLGTPAALWGFDRGLGGERLSVFQYRRWETLSEPTPNVGENDTALSLGLFEARKVQ
jgi:mediator of RNA polymerase II transcription subunit 12